MGAGLRDDRSALLSVIAIPLLYGKRIGEAARDAAAVARAAPRTAAGLQSVAVFPELGGFEMVSTALPRLLAGEEVGLDGRSLSRRPRRRDAVAHLRGAFVVASAEFDVAGAYGELRGRQRVVLRSANGDAPRWEELERA